MYRIVRVVERNGQIHQISMTAQQANFYHRLAELKAVTQPTITFHDVVIEHCAQVRQARPKNARLE